MIIAVDFDGTIAHHQFPAIGPEVPGAFRVMKKLIAAGHQLILYTMRSDIENPSSDDPDICPEPGPYLTEAVEFCRARGVEFWVINENPEQKSWTTSPKVYAHLYIDDAAFGCPILMHDEFKRPFVNWNIIEMQLVRGGHIEE